MSKQGRQPTQGQLVLGALSDKGLVRKNNEDAYAALMPPNTPSGVGGILAVADGMGGHAAGERASHAAIDGVRRLLGKGPATGALSNGRGRQLHEALTQINGEVFAAASAPETRGMGTTLSVAVVEGGDVFIGHVGDSRVYLQRGGVLTQLTPDHSWVAEEVARGNITPQEASKHPRRNLLTRAVGIAPAVEPATLSHPLESGDLLLLCSDGLHGLLSDPAIASVLAEKQPDEAAQELVRLANKAGGTDNITVVVARVVSTEPPSAGLWHIGSDATVAPRQRGSQSGPGRHVLALLLLPFTLARAILRLLTK